MNTVNIVNQSRLRSRLGGISNQLCCFQLSSIYPLLISETSMFFSSTSSTSKLVSNASYSPLSIMYMLPKSILIQQPAMMSATSTAHQQPRPVSLFSSSSSPGTQHEESNRSKFKEIPVNRSIVAYIERIGVGIPKRNPVKRRLKSLRGNDNSHTNSRSRGRFLTREEEKEELQTIRRLPSRIPPPPFATPVTKAEKIANTTAVNENRKSGKKTFSNKRRAKRNGKRHTENTNLGKQDRQRPQPQQERSIRRYPVKCIANVGTTEDSFPPGTLKFPEVAIAGRSNVGKSTLLNALLYGNHPNSQNTDESLSYAQNQRRSTRKPTARTAKLPKGLKAATSSKPGETRTIDFYRLTAKIISKTATATTSDNNASVGGGAESHQVEMQKVSLQLVDLPGYGFAYATNDKMEAWISLMKDYILNRGKSLKRILLLIDARHGMKMADIEFLESLQQALHDQQGPKEDQNQSAKRKRELPPIQIVLTKCDLVFQADLARRVTQVQQQLSDSLIRQPSALPVMFVSAQVEGQAGVLELQKELAGLVVPGISGAPV